MFQIVHCSVGLVRSNVVLTAFQVFSRVFLTWGIVYSVEAVGSTHPYSAAEHTGQSLYNIMFGPCYKGDKAVATLVKHVSCLRGWFYLPQMIYHVNVQWERSGTVIECLIRY